jgi:hypothetical protein
MTDAGIRRVFFTGGEPLLSPLARPARQHQARARWFHKRAHLERDYMLVS